MPSAGSDDWGGKWSEPRVREAGGADGAGAATASLRTAAARAHHRPHLAEPAGAAIVFQEAHVQPARDLQYRQAVDAPRDPARDEPTSTAPSPSAAPTASSASSTTSTAPAHGSEGNGLGRPSTGSTGSTGSAASSAPTHPPRARTGSDSERAVAAEVAEVADLGRRLSEAVRSVIEGKEDVVERALTVFLAGGHLLLEDVPGVGKTTLAKALARAVDARMRRIQFTPDLLPSDITGISVFDSQTHRFEFRPGAVFANIVVCDEINRASPKTQSAVLEAMEEAQVTVDGHTYPLADPFLVIATQNPLEMEGTYPLPEAQRDRFMARISVGYPHPTAELAMLDTHGAHDPLDDLVPVTDSAQVVAAQETIRRVYAAQPLKQYVVDLVAATRSSSGLRLGASPRASLHLLRAARARAALTGRDYVLPDDVRSLAVPVLEHRVLLSGESRLARIGIDEVLADVLATVPVPGR